jgi:hypothetical protein
LLFWLEGKFFPFLCREEKSGHAISAFVIIYPENVNESKDFFLRRILLWFLHVHVVGVSSKSTIVTPGGKLLVLNASNLL